MKRTLTLLLLLLEMLTVCAMDHRQKQINDIKKDCAYLYSDFTMSTPEEAFSVALGQLQKDILSWASERSGQEIIDVSPTELNQLIDTIMVRRADMYRVFAYVKKFAIAASPCFIDKPLTLVPELDGNEIFTKPEPSVEVEVPSPAPQQQSADSVASATVNRSVINLLKSNFLGRKGGILESIKKAKTFFELENILKPLQEKGDIIGYGKYATALNPEDCYLIVYDIAGNIKAFLGKGKEVRQNLKSGKNDSIRNYRGCGAIWFTINENNK